MLFVLSAKLLLIAMEIALSLDRRQMLIGSATILVMTLAV